MDNSAEGLRNEIVELTRQYYKSAFVPQPFVPGESTVPYGGRVFDESEIVILCHPA